MDYKKINVSSDIHGAAKAFASNTQEILSRMTELALIEYMDNHKDKVANGFKIVVDDKRGTRQSNKRHHICLTELKMMDLQNVPAKPERLESFPKMDIIDIQLQRQGYWFSPLNEITGLLVDMIAPKDSNMLPANDFQLIQQFHGMPAIIEVDSIAFKPENKLAKRILHLTMPRDTFSNYLLLAFAMCGVDIKYLSHKEIISRNMNGMLD